MATSGAAAIQPGPPFSVNANFKPAEHRLPLVERGGADAVTATHFRRRHPSLLLLQYRGDLLFAEPASLHCRPTPLRWTLPNTGHISGEHITIH